MQRSKGNQLAEKRKRLAELKLRKEILDLQAKIDTAKSFRQQKCSENPHGDMTAGQNMETDKDSVVDRVLELNARSSRRTRSPTPASRKLHASPVAEMPIARKKIRSPVRTAEFVPPKLSQSSVTLPAPVTEQPTFSSIRSTEKQDWGVDTMQKQRLAALENELQNQTEVIGRLEKEVSRLDQALECSLETKLEKRTESLKLELAASERNIVEHVIPSSINAAISDVKSSIEATEACLSDRIEQAPAIDEAYVRTLVDDKNREMLEKAEERYRLIQLEMTSWMETQQNQLHILKEENTLLKKQIVQSDEATANGLQIAVETQVAMALEKWIGKQNKENEKLRSTISVLQASNAKLQHKILQAEQVHRANQQWSNSFETLLSDRCNQKFTEYQKQQKQDQLQENAALCESMKECILAETKDLSEIPETLKILEAKILANKNESEITNADIIKIIQRVELKSVDALGGMKSDIAHLRALIPKDVQVQDRVAVAQSESYAAAKRSEENYIAEKPNRVHADNAPPKPIAAGETVSECNQVQVRVKKIDKVSPKPVVQIQKTSMRATASRSAAPSSTSLPAIEGAATSIVLATADSSDEIKSSDNGRGPSLIADEIDNATIKAVIAAKDSEQNPLEPGQAIQTEGLTSEPNQEALFVSKDATSVKPGEAVSRVKKPNTGEPSVIPEQTHELKSSSEEEVGTKESTVQQTTETETYVRGPVKPHESASPSKASLPEDVKVDLDDSSDDDDDSSVGVPTTDAVAVAQKMDGPERQFQEEYQYVSDVESSATSWSGNEMIEEVPSLDVGTKTESLTNVEEDQVAPESPGTLLEAAYNKVTVHEVDQTEINAASSEAMCDTVAECMKPSTIKDDGTTENPVRLHPTNLIVDPGSLTPTTNEAPLQPLQPAVEELTQTSNVATSTQASISVESNPIEEFSDLGESRDNEIEIDAGTIESDEEEEDEDSEEEEGGDSEEEEEEEEEGSEEDDGEESEDAGTSESASGVEADELVGVDKLNIGNDEEVELRRRALALLGIGGPEPDASLTSNDGADSSSDDEDDESCDDSTTCRSCDEAVLHSVLRPSSFLKDGFDWTKRSISKKSPVSFSDEIVSHEVPRWNPEEKINLFYDKVDINRFRMEDAAKKQAKANKEKSKLHTAIDSLPSFWG